MRKVLLAVLLLMFAVRSYAQIPPISSHPASATGSVVVAVAQNDLILVACAPFPKTTAVASDSAKHVFTALPSVDSADNAGMFGYWTRATAAGSLTLTCTPGATVKSNQIYTAIVKSVGDLTAVPATGTSGPAVANIASAPNDLVLAFVESGSVTNTPGWTIISNLNSNLQASQIATGPTAASFTVSSGWNLLLVDLTFVATPINLSGTLIWDDGSPIQGSVQINQMKIGVNTILNVYPIAADGTFSGPLSIDFSQTDPLVFQIILFDATNTRIGTIQETLPKNMFTNVTKAVASLTIRKGNKTLQNYAWASQ
jgi:hypothetical protein